MREHSEAGSRKTVNWTEQLPQERNAAGQSEEAHLDRGGRTACQGSSGQPNLGY